MRKINTSASDDRRTLVALLERPGDGPVIGLKDLQPKERLFLIATCSMRMVLEAVAAAALFNTKDAKVGFKSMLADVDGMMEEICRSGAEALKGKNNDRPEMH